MKANIYPGRGTWPDWNDLDTLQRDRMPAHASMVTFPDYASCRAAISGNRRYLSPNIINLRDGWECRCYADILQLPESILSFRSGFDPAIVPGGQALPAHPDLPGDTPADRSYPFPVMPPLVPAEQPILVYRRTCRLPLTWGGWRKKLVLQGISAAGYIFINGRLAGYTQGSCLPSEFDLTSNLHDGDNELFILIVPRCDGSYLENPDSRPLTGLIRDIYFEAVAAINIQDIHIRTLPVPNEDAWQLDVDVELISYRIAVDSPKLRLILLDNEQSLSETCWAVPLSPVDNQDYASPVQTTGRLHASTQLLGIEPWNDEQPRLYDLYVILEERGSRELACIHQSVGFRHLTGQGNALQINGRPLRLRGVVWPGYLSGSAGEPGVREIVKQLRLVKQNQINALYIRDYPADPILLELCDIYGLYVVDEAPLDISHPVMLSALENDPRWLDAAFERIERLVRRDINHPSVILWSARLFRYQGMWQQALADQCRQLDGTRFWHLLDLPDISREMSSRANWFSDDDTIYRCYFQWGSQTAALLRELKQILRPLEIKAIDASNGAFLIKNRRSVIPASQYQVDWLLLRNGHLILAGALDNVRVGPGEEQYIELWFGEQTFTDGADYILRFETANSEATLWSEPHEEVYYQEFNLNAAGRNDHASVQRGGRLRLESDRQHLIVSGSRFWLVFNRINGSLESWRSGDREFISAQLPGAGNWLSGLHPSVWRQLDFLDTGLQPLWQKFGFNRLRTQVVSVQDGCDGQSSVIEMVLRLAADGQPASLEMIVRYEIRAIGDLRVFTSLSPLAADLPPLPCLSLCMNLKREFDQISWYGSGPWHCLPNLQYSRHTGLYTGNQADPAAGIHLPGDEPGFYPETRWLSCKDKSGFGLQIQADQPFGFAFRPAGSPDLLPGFTGNSPERQAMAVQLFQPLPAARNQQPLKTTWYFSPSVSSGE